MLESLSSEELQFIKAIEKYKTENSCLFLSWTEVLKILKGLGYRKTARKAPTKKPAPKKAEPSTENPTTDPAAPAGEEPSPPPPAPVTLREHGETEPVTEAT